jgi:hypothetical protein
MTKKIRQCELDGLTLIIKLKMVESTNPQLVIGMQGLQLEEESKEVKKI